ncbi:hypothetical protein L6452_09920 [Arctium lappa]|uniref:Uncharacterized protein n=1 Tax=Arctium lappa TaxID=4217 RepID=A0ACB9DLW2_ARCLA|nr:hypothetical protein L6452_09920 [Arctium lappa]
MEEDRVFYAQLHKLSVVRSEEDLHHIFSILWTTRKTGVTTTEKSYIQLLLNFPSVSAVDPVLACIRSLIRRCTHDNFTSDDISQRLPPDLSLDLRTNLLMLFGQHINKWKEETSREPHLWPRTTSCNQVNSGLAPGFTCLLSSDSEYTSNLWPQHDNPATPFAETNVSLLAPMLFQPKTGGILGTLPCLKSMTWTLENHNKRPNGRLVVITLKGFPLVIDMNSEPYCFHGIVAPTSTPNTRQQPTPPVLAPSPNGSTPVSALSPIMNFVKSSDHADPFMSNFEFLFVRGRIFAEETKTKMTLCFDCLTELQFGAVTTNYVQVGLPKMVTGAVQIVGAGAFQVAGDGDRSRVHVLNNVRRGVAARSSLKP